MFYIYLAQCGVTNQRLKVDSYAEHDMTNSVWRLPDTASIRAMQGT